MRRILLVDDDTHFRRSLAIGLETHGYRVHEVSSGMDALQFLQTDQTAVDCVVGVVVDARMPGLDGFWLADQISASFPLLKVVILSAHQYPDRMNSYTMLTKPVAIPLLIETLENDQQPASGE